MTKTKKNSQITPKVLIIKEQLDIYDCIQSLQEYRQIIINLSSCDSILKLRVVDFLSGYIYALDGYRQKLEENIYSFMLF